MTISLSKERVAAITGGRIKSEKGESIVFSGLEFDSRQIRGGELFVALRGAETHGEAFLEQALARGAALALVESPELLRHAQGDRMVVVEDSLKAFSDLATAWRREVNVPILAITGSVGKTTTKEMAAALLLRRSPGAFSLKSHNNHVGVPYTLCRLSRNHAWAVVEMGMNHAGEIGTLARIAEPTAAAITRIAPAHIEFFGSLEAIARAKLEILDGLREQAPVLLNGDDEVLGRVAAELGLAERYMVRRFGTSPDCEVAVRDIVSHGMEGVTFGLEMHGREYRVRMSVPGHPTAYNAACAALAALTMFPDFPPEEIVAGLSGFSAPLMRLQSRDLPDGRRIIDDSYNANPASMQACITLAGELKASGLRVGLILGDMRELGALAERYHREIGIAAAAAAPEFLIAVGEWAELLVRPAADRGIPAFSKKSAEEAGREAFSRPFDVVIVKASRAVGLERAVSIIESLAQAKKG